MITVEHIGNNQILHTKAPCISDQDRERLKKFWLDVGDIVFSRVGSVDRRAIVREDEKGWLFSGSCLRVRVDRSKIEPLYLSYYLGHPLIKGHFRSIALGSTRPSINTTILSDLPISFPTSLAEQKAIASTLGALDDKIEVNQKMNRTLEEIARAIFKSWFVDFDPVRAKTDGRPTGLSSDISDLFPDELVDSELGQIPRGWKVSNIGKESDIKSGKRPPTKLSAPDAENHIPVYGGNGIAWYTNQVLFNCPFIITGRVGTLGTVYRVYEKCWVSDNALCCFPNDKEMFEFIYFAMKNIDYLSLNSGSTQPLLTQTTLKNQKIITPLTNAVSAFHNQTKVLFEKILVNNNENLILSELRDTLLPKLISGQVRVPDAEKFLEETAI